MIAGVRQKMRTSSRNLKKQGNGFSLETSKSKAALPISSI